MKDLNTQYNFGNDFLLIALISLVILFFQPEES